MRVRCTMKGFIKTTYSKYGVLGKILKNEITYVRLVF